MIGVLIRERHREIFDTQRHRAEGYVKMGTETAVSVSQGMPRIHGNHQKLDEKHGTDSSLESPEENNSAINLISDFWIPKLRENRFLLF